MKTRKEQIDTMLQAEPLDPELHYMLAMEHVSCGEDTQAAQCFERLLEIDPKYAAGYHMAARTLQRLDRSTEARELLNRGIPVALAQGNEHAAGEMQGLLETLS